MTEAAEPTRNVLKAYFVTRGNLDDRFATTEISEPDYLVAVQALRDRLIEEDFPAAMALQRAEDFLDSPGSYLMNEEAKLAQELRRDGLTRYREWVEDFRRVNLERVALTMLDVVALLEVPPLPHAADIGLR